MRDIIYKNDDENLFYKKWQEYLNNQEVSFRYLKDICTYQLYYSKNLLIDKSFVVIQNNKCVGICFLPIERSNNFRTISIANNYVVFPLSINTKIEKAIFDEIGKLVKKYGIRQIKFFLDPLLCYSFNRLLKYGFIDTSATTCIVDLRISKKELWKNLRKHYKSMINKVLKDKSFEIYIMNKDNANYDIHEYYRKLHHRCAGRVTRDKKTFDKQFDMLKSGYATLIGLKYEDKFIGMQYFFHYQKTVVYASGADDPEYTEKGFNIYHPILWKAQEYFKKLGYEYLEYSQPCAYSKVQGLDDYYDKKQLNISYFKRGMGARMVTLYRGIKYCDRSLFESDLKIFKERFKDA